MLNGGGMNDRQLFFDLRRSLDHLADALDDQPRVTRSLRRFARALPTSRDSLQHAVLDGRPYWRTGAYWPPTSPSSMGVSPSSSSGVASGATG